MTSILSTFNLPIKWRYCITWPHCNAMHWDKCRHVGFTILENKNFKVSSNIPIPQNCVPKIDWLDYLGNIFKNSFRKLNSTILGKRIDQFLLPTPVFMHACIMLSHHPIRRFLLSTDIKEMNFDMRVDFNVSKVKKIPRRSTLFPVARTGWLFSGWHEIVVTLELVGNSQGISYFMWNSQKIVSHSCEL